MKRTDNGTTEVASEQASGRLPLVSQLQEQREFNRSLIPSTKQNSPQPILTNTVPEGIPVAMPHRVHAKSFVAPMMRISDIGIHLIGNDWSGFQIVTPLGCDNPLLRERSARRERFYGDPFRRGSSAEIHCPC